MEDSLSPMISVVMLHWKRPENVNRLITTYSLMGSVGEILLVNNNHEFRLECNLPKVTVLNSNKDLGLFSRFALGALASYPCALIVDDDLFVPEETLLKLYEAWISDPTIIHGLIGRSSIDRRYSSKTVHGPCEIVLTRALLTTPEYCAMTLVHARRFNEELPATPKGNGEDILLSYVAMRRSKRLNMAHRLPFYDLPAPEAISLRVPNHRQHRSEVVRWCLENIVMGGSSSQAG